MNVNSFIKKALRRVGVSAIRIQPNTDPWARRLALFSSLSIDTVLDIGAHAGGYGKALRASGYEGLILSFEPQPHEAEKLRRVANRASPWKVFEVALSNFEGATRFQISSHTASSSLSPMSKYAKEMIGADEGEQIDVNVTTVDNVISSEQLRSKKIYLKCDAQGAERVIMKGAENSLNQIQVIEAELSLGNMYEDQWHFRDALDWFEQRGYFVFSIEAGFADKVSGRVMQVDAIFVRSY